MESASNRSSDVLHFCIWGRGKLNAGSKRSNHTIIRRNNKMSNCKVIAIANQKGGVGNGKKVIMKS